MNEDILFDADSLSIEQLEADITRLQARVQELREANLILRKYVGKDRLTAEQHDEIDHAAALSEEPR